MAEFKYQHVDEEAERSRRQSDESGDNLDYATLLPAWEADHLGHRMNLEKAQADGDQEAIDRSVEALATLEKAITDGRKKLKAQG